uniref:Uncharacterized protein n=1 Tax=Knipowitschia caucasica TaxID=637954 RepID=A0AAV2MFB5_KNICA
MGNISLRASVWSSAGGPPESPVPAWEHRVVSPLPQNELWSVHLPQAVCRCLCREAAMIGTSSPSRPPRTRPSPAAAPVLTRPLSVEPAAQSVREESSCCSCSSDMNDRRNQPRASPELAQS